MARTLYCAALLLAASAAGAAQTCDRACLEATLDTYVAAVIAHDPARLSTSRDARFTENGQRLALGEGLWQTATGPGGYALKLADVERGQAVLMGTIREADTPTILIARLRVAYGKITEVETLVIRNREAAEHIDEVGTPRAAWSEPVPTGRPLASHGARAYRERLLLRHRAQRRQGQLPHRRRLRTIRERPGYGRRPRAA